MNLTFSFTSTNVLSTTRTAEFPFVGFSAKEHL